MATSDLSRDAGGDVDSDVEGVLAHLAGATDRLVADVRALPEASLTEPSLLPGWTRGHVLAHVARGGDACVRLLEGAATGEAAAAYESREARDAEIAYAASRPLDDHLTDLGQVTERLAAAARAVAADRWSVPLRFRSGVEKPASAVLWTRRVEIEIHHVDLDVGYTSADWTADVATRLLDEVVDALRNRPDAPDLRLEGRDTGRVLALGRATDVPVTDLAAEGVRTVSGPEHRLAAWLAGRSDGRMLVATPAGRLPPVPRWM